MDSSETVPIGKKIRDINSDVAIYKMENGTAWVYMVSKDRAFIFTSVSDAETALLLRNAMKEA